MIFLIIPLTLLILLLLISYYFSNKVAFPKTFPYEETYKLDFDRGKINEKILNSPEKEEVYIDSPYGYRLHGLYFPKSNSKKAIILVHGITWSLFGSVKYMDMFIEQGFNILIYDHRNHGLSGGKNSTFGYYEKYDLKACTDWLYKKLGDDAIIGLHGESMGAGTALQNIAIDPRIKFCIADCGYSDVPELLKLRLKLDFKVNTPFLLYTSSALTKLRTGWCFKDSSPIKDLPKVDVPVLFVHGEDDVYVPTYMSKQMYEVKRGMKDIYIAPNAGHAEAYLNNKEEYKNKVHDFLNDLNLL